MVQSIFKVRKSSVSAIGWEIEDTKSGKVLDMPECIYEEMNGKYMKADDMLELVGTLQIALAGVTDSLNMVNNTYFDKNSVLKSILLRDSIGTIDDEIDFLLDNVKEYEKFHIVEMGRDKAGDDTSIHAYIETPKNGRVRAQFDRSVRLEAKRNNIKYWIEDYKIATGTAGGVFIRPISTPIEI